MNSLTPARSRWVKESYSITREGKENITTLSKKERFMKREGSRPLSVTIQERASRLGGGKTNKKEESLDKFLDDGKGKELQPLNRGGGREGGKG